MSHKFFVSMPVKDLGRSVAFFEALGFRFDPKFASEHGAAMLIGEHSFAMLVAESLYKTFTKRQLCDTATHVEAAFGILCESRAEVDAMLAKALAGGGREPEPAQDHGFMYARSFEDLDGHHWEVQWMNPNAAQ
jgi:hypothetical protein